MSILGEDNVLIDEMDERVKDYRRLGSFFQPWFYHTQEDPNYESITQYFYIDKLKQKCEGVNWTKFDKYIKSNGINVVNHHSYVAYYLSILIINLEIESDNIYDGLTNNNLKCNMSTKLNAENHTLGDIINDCYDHNALPDLKTQLYIHKNDYNGEYVLNYFMEHYGYGMNTRLVFEEKEKI